MVLQGLDVIELTNVKLLTREMTSEIYALKGMLLAQIGRSDDANKVFSAAVQMHDTLVKAWALWGDYLEQLFTRDARQISLGTQAITCFLHACRHQNESKSRKYLAKVCPITCGALCGRLYVNHCPLTTKSGATHGCINYEIPVSDTGSRNG